MRVDRGRRLPQFRRETVRHGCLGRFRNGVADYSNDAGVTRQCSYMATDPRRAARLDRLPLPYATALRMRDEGFADEVIAEHVGVDKDALPTFMRLAEAKLASVSAD